MTGNVVPFNRRRAPAIWSDGTVQHDCTEHVHLFASVPGRCKCGSEFWTLDETAPAEDGGSHREETTGWSPPAE